MLKTVSKLPDYIAKTYVIYELTIGNANFTGSYYLTDNGDVYTKGKNGYNQVAYLPSDSTGGVRELGSAFEDTPLQYAEYALAAWEVRKIVVDGGRAILKKWLTSKGTKEAGETYFHVTTNNAAKSM